MEKPKSLIDAERLNELLMESDAFCAAVVGHSEDGIALAEWEDGNQTHLALEVMGSDGAWLPLAVVSLAACRDELNRGDLRQFPLFRLAWYGQLGLPNNVPQAGAPSQERRAGAVSIIPASDRNTLS